MPKSVITLLEERTDEMTFGRIPYDVEIKGRRIGGLRVAKLPRIDAGDSERIEIIIPAPDGVLALKEPTADGIARAVSPTARVVSRSKAGTARRMLYTA
jgi:hypothetical protein